MKSYNYMQYAKVLLAGMVLLVSCSKKEDEKSDASVVGKWKMIAASSDKPIDWIGDGNLTTDLFGEGDECDNDDIYVFYATGNYEVNEGETKCSASSPFIHTEGIWSMKENTLTIGLDGEFINNTVLQLDNNTLKVSNETDWLGEPYVATRIFRRQ